MRSSLVLLIVSGLVLPAFSSLDAAAAEHAAEAAVAAEALDAAALGADDACLAEGGQEGCALSALQVKKRKVSASMEAAHTGKSEGRDADADAATHESREHGDGAHKDGYYPSTYSTYSTDSGSPYSTDDSRRRYISSSSYYSSTGGSSYYSGSGGSSYDNPDSRRRGYYSGSSYDSNTLSPRRRAYGYTAGSSYGGSAYGSNVHSYGSNPYVPATPGYCPDSCEPGQDCLDESRCGGCSYCQR